MYQSVFKRYELKYMLTAEQKEELLQLVALHMQPDRYGRTTIGNIYFDTENYRLIRRSLEKPVYKEKLRIRSYARTGEEEPVFVELKKKYDAVVYKRRVVMPCNQAMEWLQGGSVSVESTQIIREIEYFRNFYGPLHPAVLLSYDRQAWLSPTEDFRVTLDENILSRSTGISLNTEFGGTPLLPPDMTLLELKTPGGIPLWMTRFLTEQRIYKTSFSKYGTAYSQGVCSYV